MEITHVLIRSCRILLCALLLGSGGAVLAQAPQQPAPAAQPAQPAQGNNILAPAIQTITNAVTGTGGTGTATTAQAQGDQPFDRALGQWGTGCWLCALIQAADQTRLRYGQAVFERLGEALRPLLIAVLGVWLLFQAGRLFMPFGPDDGAAKIMGGVFIRILLAIAVMIGLQNYRLLWSFQEGIVSGGLAASGVILDEVTETFTARETLPYGCTGFNSTGGTSAIPVLASGQGVTVTPVTPLDLQILNSEETRGKLLQCRLQQMMQGFGVGIAMGVSLLDRSIAQQSFWHVWQNMGQGVEIKTGQGLGETATNAAAGAANAVAQAAVGVASGPWIIMRFIAGMALVLVFGFIALLLGFRFLDFIVKWTVITIISPMLLFAMVFPSTRQITFGGIRLVFQDALVLLIMAVMVALMIGMFSEILNPTQTAAFGLDPSIRTMDDLVNYRMNNGVADPAFWNILVIGLLTAGMLGQAPNLAAYAVNLPATFNVPPIGAKVVEGLTGIAQKFLGKLPDWTVNRDWNRRKRLNNYLRRQLMRPR